MGDKVFINGRAAVHAGSAGKSVAFPDVCLCPPAPPSGPIPTPLPNTAQATDLQGCAATVTIEGNRVAHAQSYVAKSTGNEVAQSTGGGIITHMVQGAAYFQTFSFDVFIEGQPAVRHLDLLTHNHMAKVPGNTPPAPWMSVMTAGPGPAPKRTEKQEREGKDFIHLILRDELDRPVADLALTIETPGKKTIERRSPTGGEIIVRGLKKGTCQVTVLDGQGKPMKQVKPNLFAPAPDGAPASLPTGKPHTLTCQIATATFEFAHPKPGMQGFPKLVLESSDGAYKQQRTARNNLLRSGRKLRVRFDYLPKGATFTLTRHDSPSLSRKVFDKASFDDIVDRKQDGKQP
jgi:Domain of unknown function (DUF4150)